MVTLDIGCGGRKKGDVGIDIRKIEGVTDYVCDVSKRLPFEDNKFSAIIAHDVYEHFPRGQAVEILKEWVRVMEHGGTITIKMPNLHTLASAYVKGEIDVNEFQRKVYGGGTLSLDEYDMHKQGFDHKSIVDVLKEVGLVNIRVQPRGLDGVWSNLIVQAEKPK